MTDRLKRLCDEIRSLEPDEQAHVLHLLGDLGAMPEPAVERAWLQEARRGALAMSAPAEDGDETTTSRDAVNSFLKR